jgi:hypothetical protein
MKRTVVSIFRNWFVNAFLPWFSEAVWPLLQAAVLDIIKDWLEKLRKFLTSRDKRGEGGARNRAAEAEQKAKAASSRAEVEKYEAIAAVWRQVADEYRQKNEELERYIETFLKDSGRLVRRQMDRLKPNVEAKQSTLEIGNRRIPLLNPPAS